MNLLKAIAVSSIILTSLNVSTAQAYEPYRATSTDQFYNDFQNKATEMELKTKGRQIEIPGVVESIDRSLESIGRYTLNLKTTQGDPLSLYLKLSEKDKLPNLQRHTSVIALCDKVNEALFSFNLTGCIIESFTAPAVVITPEIAHSTDFTNGLKQGVLNSKLNAAKKMKANGLATKTIIKYTGLTSTQIQKL